MLTLTIGKPFSRVHAEPPEYLDRGTQDQAPLALLLPFDPAQRSQPRSAPDRDSPERKPLDTLYQRLLDALVATWPLVIVGILGTWAALKTLSAIKKQADIMVDSERAWLIVKADPPRTSQKSEGNQITMGFMFDWHVRNTGRTVAFVTRLGARFHPLHSLADLPEKPDIEQVGPIQATEHYPNGLSIGPGSSVSRYTRSSVSPGQQRKISDKEVIWIAYGVVEYRTTVSQGDVKETSFCYLWTPQSEHAAESFVPSDVPRNYTKST